MSHSAADTVNPSVSAEILPQFSILVLHGPNLNLLGQREPQIYGAVTLDEINLLLAEEGKKLQARVSSLQSNHEGVLVDAIHQALEEHQGILINAGAYTHTHSDSRCSISSEDSCGWSASE